MTDSTMWTDGNSLAGPLQDILNPDITGAVGGCGNCGWSGSMVDVRVFDHAPGVVARCANCDHVLMRLVRGPGRAWLDMRGLDYVQLPMVAEA
jgi:hypothetical protein